MHNLCGWLTKLLFAEKRDEGEQKGREEKRSKRFLVLRGAQRAKQSDEKYEVRPVLSASNLATLQLFILTLLRGNAPSTRHCVVCLCS